VLCADLAASFRAVSSPSPEFAPVTTNTRSALSVDLDIPSDRLSAP
jgi:hypothetical protein